MRIVFFGRVLLLALLVSLPTAATTLRGAGLFISATPRSTIDLDVLASASVMSIGDGGAVHLSSISAVPISVTPYQGGGTIQIVSDTSLHTSGAARFGRRTFVWVSQDQGHGETPIPEPGAALLFAVGTVLVGLRLRRAR